MEWIAVTDDMPRPDDGFVLVYSATAPEPYHMAYYNRGHGRWYASGHTQGITHWQRITPPQGDREPADYSDPKHSQPGHKDRLFKETDR